MELDLRQKQDQRKIEQESDSWEAWPYLPMKKRDEAGEVIQVGIVHAGRKNSLYLTSIVEMTGDHALDTYPVVHFANVAAMLADGWEID